MAMGSIIDPFPFIPCQIIIFTEVRQSPRSYISQNGGPQQVYQPWKVSVLMTRLTQNRVPYNYVIVNKNRVKGL